MQELFKTSLRLSARASVERSFEQLAKAEGTSISSMLTSDDTESNFKKEYFAIFLEVAEIKTVWCALFKSLFSVYFSSILIPALKWTSLSRQHLGEDFAAGVYGQKGGLPCPDCVEYLLRVICMHNLLHIST